MARIVVPFRGADGKGRLAPAPPEARRALALAMLADVVAACAAVDETTVVTADPEGRAVAAEHGAKVVPDPGGGQGAAVAAALVTDANGPSLVVNADLPCAVPEDVRALLRAVPGAGLALVRSRDGRTNALALARPELFAPLYGTGSADRFREHAERLGVPATVTEIPNLADDVDTLDDLRRVEQRVGPRTLAALTIVGLEVHR